MAGVRDRQVTEVGLGKLVLAPGTALGMGVTSEDKISPVLAVEGVVVIRFEKVLEMWLDGVAIGSTWSSEVKAVRTVAPLDGEVGIAEMQT